MQIFDSFTPEVADLLRNGKVGVIPTDTIYGLATSLYHQEAIERIYDIKDRDLKKPVGTILISDPLQIEDYVSPRELLAAEVYWPGPVSVVLDVGNALYYAHKGAHSLPFRVPDKLPLRTILETTGPLATTSANTAGELPATTMQEALAIFRENVDFYVDGGDLSHQKPSKIIRFDKQGNVEVLRDNV